MKIVHNTVLTPQQCYILQGCLVQVGNGIELEAVGLQFEPYRWRPCGVTWDSSRTVVVLKLRRTSALHNQDTQHVLEDIYHSMASYGPCNHVQQLTLPVQNVKLR